MSWFFYCGLAYIIALHFSCSKNEASSQVFDSIVELDFVTEETSNISFVNRSEEQFYLNFTREVLPNEALFFLLNLNIPYNSSILEFTISSNWSELEDEDNFLFFSAESETSL